MSLDQDSLGDIASLATALGLLDAGGGVNTAFFSDPAGTMSGVLRDATRRQALLDFIDQTLGQGGAPITEGQATWAPLLNVTDTVALYLVVAPSVAQSGGTVLGIGARAATTGTPGAEGRLSVPIVLVPPGSGSLTFLPGSSSLDATASLTVQVDVASASLASAGLSLQIPLGTGGSPAVTVQVHGLVLPGSTTPIDLSLDGSQPFGQEMVHALIALVEAQLQAAASTLAPDATALLALLGLDPQAPVPLPIAEIAVGGAPALQAWLTSFSQSSQALQHWVANLATLTGGTIPGGVGAGSAASATWALASDLSATVGLSSSAGTAGGTVLALSAGIVGDLGGTPAASLELSATLFAVTVGAHPAITALPALSAFARYAGSPLLNVTEAGTSLVVGGLRAGVALDSARRVVFVVAADEVDIGPPGATTHHDSLDLTSPDALAAIGSEALSGLASGLLSGLGAQGAPVGELIGLTAPTGAVPGWPVLDPAALLTNPFGEIGKYHAAVLALGGAAYAQLLGSLVTLFGKSVPVSGSGSAADPWVPVTVGDVQLVLWADPSTPGASAIVHVGAQWSPPAASLGASGPTLSLRLVVDALDVPLAAPGTLSALANITLSAAVSSPAGSPVTVAIAGGSVQLSGATLSCQWAPRTGLSATFAPTGAEVTVGGVTAPLALPTLAPDGTISVPAPLDGQVIETLVAAALSASGSPWIKTVPDLLGLGQAPAAAGLSAAAAQASASGPASPPTPGLLSDPLGWLAARLRNQVAAEGDAAIKALTSTLASLVQGAQQDAPAGSGAPGTPTRRASRPLVHPTWACPSGSTRPGRPSRLPRGPGYSPLRPCPRGSAVERR